MLTDTTTTKRLLAAGVIATPLFFTAAFAQAFSRDGFDLSRHMLSQLAAGDLGWLQIANFIVTGTLFLAAAAGMRRTLRQGPGAKWGPGLVGVVGAGLIAAGVFVTDPAAGYPVGSVEGETSWHGMLHNVAAMVGGLALLAASLVFARRFLAEKRKGWAIYSAASGIVYTVLPQTNPELMSLLFAVASLIGWTWISTISIHLVTTGTAETTAPRDLVLPS
ncbi:DUF998 domain-containing protein [Streptosporangium canum]|uniref:DUF998 domain-containing protein n=1 Tax=Streptosporangium canum TaxID=324952 RepID=UPI00341EBEF9